MKDLPFLPILPFSLIAGSVTYVESMGLWSSNPPPATKSTLVFNKLTGSKKSSLHPPHFGSRRSQQFQRLPHLTKTKLHKNCVVSRSTIGEKGSKGDKGKHCFSFSYTLFPNRVFGEAPWEAFRMQRVTAEAIELSVRLIKSI